MITHSAIKLLHNIIQYKAPESIFNLYSIPNKRRAVSDLRLKYIPKSKKLKDSFLYNATKVYNKLPLNIKNSNKLLFKIQSKDFLKQNNISDTLD